MLTIGATANQNGTAMFEGVTVLFLAQFFGVDLSLSSQIFVMLVCILAGIGTAGVPAGSLPVIALILGGVGVPPEGIGLILGRRPLPGHVPHGHQRGRQRGGDSVITKWEGMLESPAARDQPPHASSRTLEHGEGFVTRRPSASALRALSC